MTGPYFRSTTAICLVGLLTFCSLLAAQPMTAPSEATPSTTGRISISSRLAKSRAIKAVTKAVADAKAREPKVFGNLGWVFNTMPYWFKVGVIGQAIAPGSHFVRLIAVYSDGKKVDLEHRFIEQGDQFKFKTGVPPDKLKGFVIGLYDKNKRLLGKARKLSPPIPVIRRGHGGAPAVPFLKGGCYGGG